MPGDPKRITVAVVTGGREYSDRAAVFAALDALAPTVLVSGSARGADTLAEQWADARAVWCIRVPVGGSLWDRHKGKAGPARNRLMCRLVDGLVHSMTARPVCVAFPGGKGTANMRRETAGTMDVLDGLDLDAIVGWAS